MNKGAHKPVILHVEDDNSIALTIAGILDSYAEIIHAGTIELAKKCLNEHTFDLVILDLQLPDGSGLDILPLITEENSIPVIIHSATEVAETASNVSAVLHKGHLDPDDLIKTVKGLLEK